MGQHNAVRAEDLVQFNSFPDPLLSGARMCRVQS
jgi:hypothetical protein